MTFPNEAEKDTFAADNASVIIWHSQRWTAAQQTASTCQQEKGQSDRIITLQDVVSPVYAARHAGACLPRPLDAADALASATSTQ